MLSDRMSLIVPSPSFPTSWRWPRISPKEAPVLSVLRTPTIRRAVLRGMSRAAVGCVMILVAASCGGGTDGQSVPPPTIPSPPTAPPTEPPARTVRARVWLHSVAQNAGGYYAGDEIVLVAEFDERVSVLGSPRLAIEIGKQVGHAVFSPWVEDDFPPERPSWRQRFVYEVAPEDMDQDGISVAADGFDFSSGALLDASGAEIAVEIYAVATARESPDPVAPGEALGSHRVTGTPEPRVCSDERERALNYNRSNGVSPILVHEWDGEPFRFYWDSTIPEDRRKHAQSGLGLVERVADAIEGQIGYPLLEIGGWVDEADRGFGFSEDNIWPCDGWNPPRRIPVARQNPGMIVATVHPNEISIVAAARPHCAVIFWTAGGLDNGREGCPACGYHAATHEIFHLFGFSHSPKVEGQSQSPPGEGVHMSESLSAGRPAIWPRPELAGLTWDDMDALRCIFPSSEQ